MALFKFKKLSKIESYSFLICSFLALIGIILIILGIVADHMPVTNELRKAQANFPWRYLGLILFCVAGVLAIIVLLVFAKRSDRIADRELRRKQRLSAMMSDVDNSEEVVVSEGKIVDSNKEAK